LCSGYPNDSYEGKPTKFLKARIVEDIAPLDTKSFSRGLPGELTIQNSIMAAAVGNNDVCNYVFIATAYRPIASTSKSKSARTWTYRSCSFRERGTAVFARASFFSSFYRDGNYCSVSSTTSSDNLHDVSGTSRRLAGTCPSPITVNCSCPLDGLMTSLQSLTTVRKSGPCNLMTPKKNAQLSHAWWG